MIREPFYGSVLMKMNKVLDKKINTGCVGLADVMYILKINPKYWGSLDDSHKRGLIKHELGHIVNFHLTEYSHLTDHETANLAMDIFINR